MIPAHQTLSPERGASWPAVQAVTAADLVATAARTWRAGLASAAGASALADVTALGDAQLDLTAAHPSGIAQLFAGRPTRLSNLVREGAALSQARRRARAVAAAEHEHAMRSGLATAFLAIGLATWTDADDAEDSADALAADAEEDTLSDAPDDATVPRPTPVPRTRRAPVLLRPVTVTARGRGEQDYDLALEPSLEINPLLAGALRRRGALLDPAALARGAFTEAGFDPRPALERIGSLGAALLDGFRLEDALLVGAFVHPEQLMVDDLDALAKALPQHEVLAALAGDSRARTALSHPLPPVLRGDRGLDQERGVGDLDPAQAHVLDVLAAGHHLLVDTPPGSDVASTVAAVVADATAGGRRVLYVAGHRRAADLVVRRLQALGLDDVLLDVAPHSGWRGDLARRLLGAMTVEPLEVDGEKVAIVDRELLERRRRLLAYVAALHEVRSPWGCSAHDALQALATLTSTRPGPRTSVRLRPAIAESLTTERLAQAASDLVTAAGLGAFTAGVTTTAWYGADLLTPERARRALERVERLRESVTHLHLRTGEVATATGLLPAETFAAWAQQLEMLGGVRRVLDVFQPLAFERSAADMVAATASPQWRTEHGITMDGRVRRRLRRQAKDLLRPGTTVPDLHAALQDVQRQRDVWQAHCPAGGWPRLPVGLASIEAEHRKVAEDLAALSAVLPGEPLESLGWGVLLDRLARLEADAEALDTLPERSALLRDLRARGLDDLLEDLAARHVSAGLVAAELDLAWWSAVFEEIVRQDPVMAAYDGAALARLVAELRTLDRRHVTDRALLHVATAREAVRRRLHTHDAQTQALFAELVEDRFASLRTALERYPDVAGHLRPCLVASPMLVPHLLPTTRSVDLVVLDAVGHLPLELVAGALARGRQVLVVGDLRTATGSALPALAEVLPTVTLGADARRHPRLTAFLAEHGYGSAVAATPLPTTDGLLRLDLVDGTGMPGADGAVHSTTAEVAHVVRLVVEHALARPAESLAVVAGSPVHATLLREAVLAAVRERPDLEAFTDPGAREPFVVVDLEQTPGLHRDAIVLSLGFGRTPHGRVLHRFGALQGPQGEALLLGAVGAARRRLSVVTSLAADDLDADRLPSGGPALLRDLLRTAAEPDRTSLPHEPEASAPDRLLLDLAERLWRMGLTVALEHAVPGGARLPLVVGHPDLPGEWLVAVLTDDEAYLSEPSVRVRDRQVAERLERLGWGVVQLWSAALFLDPQGEADAICQAVVEAHDERMRARSALAAAVVAAAPTPEPSTAEPSAAEPGAGQGAVAGHAIAGHAIAAGDATAAGHATESSTDALERVDDERADAEAALGSSTAPTAAEAATDEPTVVEPTTAGSADPEPSAAERTTDDGAGWPRTAPARARALDTASLIVQDALDLAIPVPRGPRPDVPAGRPVGAYTDDQLDDLASWLLGGDVAHDVDALVAALRGELGFTRRGSRVDAVLRGAARRALGG